MPVKVSSKIRAHPGDIVAVSGNYGNSQTESFCLLEVTTVDRKIVRGIRFDATTVEGASPLSTSSAPKIWFAPTIGLRDHSFAPEPVAVMLVDVFCTILGVKSTPAAKNRGRIVQLPGDVGQTVQAHLCTFLQQQRSTTLESGISRSRSRSRSQKHHESLFTSSTADLSIPETMDVAAVREGPPHNMTRSQRRSLKRSEEWGIQSYRPT